MTVDPDPDVDPDLTDDVAVVTGGTRGIGRAIARRLAAAGATTVATYRADGDAAAETERTLAALDAETAVRQFDVGESEAVRANFEAIRETHGVPSILVNNAGVMRNDTLVRMSDEQWSEVVRTNLTGAFHCTRAALRGMLRRDGGRVVNVASVAAERGWPGQANYAASKAGLLGLTRSAAREYGGVDVMVNNAAIQIPRRLREMTKAEFDRIHAVNVGGTFFGTKLAAEEMIDRGVEGAIVNTASISSTEAQFGQVGYDSTKGAVRMITRGSALELAEAGIRVNAVAPGQIATEFTEGWSERAERRAAADELLKPVPLGRAGTPADVAGAYLFLASDDAGYVTGELLQVDGGWQVC